MKRVVSCATRPKERRPLEAYNPSTGYYVKLDLPAYDISAENFKVDTSQTRRQRSTSTLEEPHDPFARLQSHIGPAANAREP